MSLQPNEWDQYRRRDDTIDLLAAWKDHHHLPSEPTGEELLAMGNFFRMIDNLQRINSRQAATLALLMATMTIIEYRGGQT